MVYQYPQMYETGQRNLEFNTRLLLYWLGTGIYQAFVVFFGVFFIWGKDTMFTNGHVEGMYGFGAFCYFAVIFTVNLRLALECRYWTVFTYVFLIVCTAIWLPWMAIEGGVQKFITDGIMYHVAFHLWTTGAFWLGVLFIVVLGIFPVVAIEYLRRQLRPQNYQIIQELKRLARLERERKAIELGGGRVGIFKSRKAIRKAMRSASAERDPKYNEQVDSKSPDIDHLDLESKFTGFAFAPDTSTHDTLSHEFNNQNTTRKSQMIATRLTGYAFAPDDNANETLSHEFVNQNTSKKSKPVKQNSSSSSSSAKPQKTTLPYPQ